ncbi:hypothetical protein FJ941_26090 [Mesorhizobium sp. B2-3-13]|nr:hypothetical protein FJ941_26090 [Mesorhizobium sp. B2-3-13]
MTQPLLNELVPDFVHKHPNSGGGATQKIASGAQPFACEAPKGLETGLFEGLAPFIRAVIAEGRPAIATLLMSLLVGPDRSNGRQPGATKVQRWTDGPLAQEAILHLAGADVD